jgi:hypothetical protein
MPRNIRAAMVKSTPEYPRDANRGISGKPGEESSREIVGPVFVLE